MRDLEECLGGGSSPMRFSVERGLIGRVRRSQGEEGLVSLKLPATGGNTLKGFGTALPDAALLLRLLGVKKNLVPQAHHGVGAQVGLGEFQIAPLPPHRDERRGHQVGRSHAWLVILEANELRAQNQFHT